MREMMCSRPDRPGPPTHMSHRMPTAIGAWSSFSRDRDVALTRLPLCSLMNRNHQQPTRPSLLQVSLARSQFTGKVFISTPEDTGPAYTQMKVHRPSFHSTPRTPDHTRVRDEVYSRNYIPHQGAPPRRVVAGPSLCGETKRPAKYRTKGPRTKGGPCVRRQGWKRDCHSV